MSRQSATFFAAFCSAVLLSLAPVLAAPVSIDLVPIGDPGNAADTATDVGSFGHGSVSYNYNIGTYDVTLTQYTAFLNAVAASDPNNLYTSSMGTYGNTAGISRSGSSGSYTYTVIGSGQRPVTFVSWYDAARFTNWLTNGQGSGGTETGVYTLTGPTTLSGTLPADHSALVGGATKWFIPTENEWYKAAYYKGGGTIAGYWAYPFQSDTQPTVTSVPGDSNSGNFYSTSNGFAVTQSGSYSGSQNYLTDVGAYTSALSPYGSFDMGGDVLQWNESLVSSGRGRRGSNWDARSEFSAASFRSFGNPTLELAEVGFRVAELPEPSTITLFVLGTLGVVFAARRRKLNSRA